MKRAGWYLLAGAVAGFAGVLGFHGGGTPAPVALGQPKAGGSGRSRAVEAEHTGETGDGAGEEVPACPLHR